MANHFNISPDIPSASLGLFDIIFSQDRPGYVLPPDVCVTEDFRAKFNAWAASFFSKRNVLDDGQVITVGSKIHMNPRTLEALKASIRARSGKEPQ